MPTPLLSAKEAKKRFKKFGFRLLEAFRGVNHSYRVKCAAVGHVQRKRASNIFSGRGCMACRDAGQRLPETEIRRRLGRITVIGKIGLVSEMHQLRCYRCGFRWRTTLNSIFCGTGCPSCGHEKTASACRLSQTEAVKRFKENGLLLLESYAGQLHFHLCRCRKCGKKHRVRVGSQCPTCPAARLVSEGKVRAIFERLTGWKFPKASPSSVPWLHGLHLDGYNIRHRVAFEYQGPQHRKAVGHWRKSKTDLKKQKMRDERKRAACRRNGVTLIRISYLIQNRESYIRRRLERASLL